MGIKRWSFPPPYMCKLQLQLHMAWMYTPGPGPALWKQAWRKQLPLRRKADSVPFSKWIPITEQKVSLYLGIFIQWQCVWVLCSTATWRIHHDHHWLGIFIFVLLTKLKATACPPLPFMHCALNVVCVAFLNIVISLSNYFKILWYIEQM